MLSSEVAPKTIVVLSTAMEVLRIFERLLRLFATYLQRILPLSVSFSS